ncbi:aquaporin-9-like isoform X2 [Antedon mediterranea]|uniref:aquaporin-9-like isoform X2 n=1 Tax=Antedon mediterranea TaxID=105859 RepID=UPI003AF9488A
MGLWYESTFEKCSCASKSGWKQVFSELLGMFIFVFISGNVVANVNCYNNDNLENSINNTFSYDASGIFYINFGISFGYMLGLYISIENAGFLNPGLTLVFRFMGKIETKDMLLLLAAQFCGAFLGSFLIWGLYFDQLNDFEDDNTGLLFCSVVNGGNYGIASLDVLLKSSLFAVGVLAIIDNQKKEKKDEPFKTVKPPKSFEPFLIGLLLLVVGMAFSYHAPFYFNPFQDFAGRLVALIAGCEQMCTFDNPNWWPVIPLFVPVVGSFIGALVYIIFIENNHTKDQRDPEQQTASASQGNEDEDISAIEMSMTSEKND